MKILIIQTTSGTTAKIKAFPHRFSHLWVRGENDRPIVATNRIQLIIADKILHLSVSFIKVKKKLANCIFSGFG